MRLKVLLTIAVLASIFATTPVLADTHAHIVVTASGYVTFGPSGLVLTYIDDWQVDLSWTPTNGSVGTMIRAAYGRQPSSPSDGYLVYNGSASNCSDTAVAIANPEPAYYSAWAIHPDGSYSSLYTKGDTEEFMSASFLFLGWILLSVMLTFLALKVKLILFRLAPAISWTGLGIWLLIGNVTNLGIASAWTQMLGFVFIIMAIGSLLLQIKSDTQHESVTRGKRGFPGAESERWEEWGPKKSRKPAKQTSEDRQAEYRMKVRGAVQRGEERRRATAKRNAPIGR